MSFSVVCLRWSMLSFQTFSTPNHHPRSKPFVDHVVTFSIADNRIWFRNFQILEENGELVEIGTDCILSYLSKSHLTNLLPFDICRSVPQEMKNVDLSQQVIQVQNRPWREIKRVTGWPRFIGEMTVEILKQNYWPSETLHSKIYYWQQPWLTMNFSDVSALTAVFLELTCTLHVKIHLRRRIRSCSAGQKDYWLVTLWVWKFPAENLRKFNLIFPEIC